MFILRQWYVKKAIRKYLQTNKDVLFYDAGAGFCQYSYFVLKSYNKAAVYATDLQIDIEREKRFLGQHASFDGANADLQTFVSPQKADMVIAIDILEHIENDEAVLKNFHSSMKENAVLIIHTPSDKDAAATFTSEHVRPGYSMTCIVEKATANGFQVIEGKYSYGFWGSLYWKLTVKNSLSLISFSSIIWILLPFYILVIFPFALIFMCLDFITNNGAGNGILLVCKKSK